jgi:hypothetical protein
MQQNNNRMSTLITTHPIFTRTEKEQQQQSVDSSISFSSRFFFQNKKPNGRKARPVDQHIPPRSFASILGFFF